MRIAIIGAGIGGMSAAFDLNRAGHEVTIFEAAGKPGGLAAGFKEPGWDWSVEQFYHHWFQSDADMLGLINELGWMDDVTFRRPLTVMYHKEKFYPLDSPIKALFFPGYNFFQMVRFGLVTVYLRYIAGWKPLEKITAEAWMRKYYGDTLYKLMYQPLLEGKFGPHAREVNMAWMWARLKARTTKLGTFRGGFQAFSDRFAAELQRRGVSLRFGTPIQQIAPRAEGGFEVSLAASGETFDQVLVTVSPHQMARMAPALPAGYLQGLLNMKSMGAVVMVLSMKQQLSRDRYYWFNLPKAAGYPFLALVEHTNFLSPEYFGGDHIVYCGDYLDPDHEYFKLSQEQLLERFMPSFKRINPDFSPEWIKKVWLFKSTYAQPVPQVDHSANIPAIRTPLKGLYFASMSQVYPWDRGTNYAVQIARQTARMMLADMK